MEKMESRLSVASLTHPSYLHTTPLFGVPVSS